jgi:hypothetical protein
LEHLRVAVHGHRVEQQKGWEAMSRGRRIVAATLGTLGVLGLLSVFVVQAWYYQAMPRDPQSDSGRVHPFSAIRTRVYVTEQELRRATLSELLATAGFVAFALAAYIGRPKQVNPEVRL